MGKKATKKTETSQPKEKKVKAEPIPETPPVEEGKGDENPSEVQYVPECEGAPIGACDLNDPVCQNCKAEPHPDFAFCVAKKEEKGGEKLIKTKKARTGGKGKVSVAKEYAKAKIAEGKWTRKQIVAMFSSDHPDLCETTIGTVVSDSKNPNYYQNKKYGYDFPKLVVQDPATKILHYEGEPVNMGVK